MTKPLILLAMFLSAFPAFACPDLAGNYDCKSEAGPVNTFIITKASDKDPVVYTINGTKLVANGVPDTRHKGDGFPTTYTTTCEAQNLRARIQTHISSPMCPTMPLAVDSLTVFTPQGKDMVMDDLTVLLCPDKAPFNIKDKSVCTRK